MFRLKVGDIVPADELERAVGFFTHYYLTSKRAKLGNSVTVSKNPEHLSAAELHVMCDRMSADPDKYAKLWQENKADRSSPPNSPLTRPKDQPHAHHRLRRPAHHRFTYTKRHAEDSTVTGIFIEHKHSTYASLAASIRDGRTRWMHR